MVIAAARLVLDFWGNEELSDKRKLISELSTKVLREFSLPLAEVEDHDDLERCVLGLCFCSSERPAAETRMRSILQFIDKTAAARVVSEEYDLIHFN